MIYVKIQTDKATQTIELYAEGHAGYAPQGEDIVCSAVSILCYSLEAYVLCQPRERFSSIRTERGDGYTLLTVTVKDAQDYATVSEAITPARLAFKRLTTEFPRRIRFFEDIPQ